MPCNVVKLSPTSALCVCSFANGSVFDHGYVVRRSPAGAWECTRCPSDSDCRHLRAVRAAHGEPGSGEVERDAAQR